MLRQAMTRSSKAKMKQGTTSRILKALPGDGVLPGAVSRLCGLIAWGEVWERGSAGGASIVVDMLNSPSSDLSGARRPGLQVMTRGNKKIRPVSNLSWT